MNISRILVISCLAFSLAGCSVDVDVSGTNPPAAAGINTSIKPRTDAGNPKIAELSALLKKTADLGKLSKEDKQKSEELLHLILPSEEYIGADKEWKVTCHANLIELNLMSKEGNTRFMWFHVLYKKEKPKHYGSEDFGPYRGMGAADAHYFILVGNLELRAVAGSDDYKDDAKIKDMLSAFSLKAIEEL